ncbi:hyaluronidase-3-like [Rhinatrema bivittatum]|uniref:hyaluronidase-3-like n=1 Tax=Rhinatrema bivittatum TaxID=194408 RepID=UPI001129472C|nr:hyaluronidase-3-like [Rhinatrema bivittatum]
MTPALTLLTSLSFWLNIMQLSRGDGCARSSDPAFQKPFIVVWNIPTMNCQKCYGVSLPLRVFDIVENQGSHFCGQNITILYKNKFGFYPYITKDGSWVNGGIPQNMNLKKHLVQASSDIHDLLNRDFQGLAVIDWEEWRPQWNQNWGFKKVYKEASTEWVLRKYPRLPKKEAISFAKLEFERTAQVLMTETLRTAKELRPRGLWGFYGFPDCLNHNWNKGDKGTEYTGQCKAASIHRNNQLMWLWKASTAIYPSIYLRQKLKDSITGLHYVHYRVKEALRVAGFNSSIPVLPVLVYSRVSYMHSLRFLSERDLLHTIGESAALGAAGVVLWGDHSFSSSARRCVNLRRNLMTSLGKYIVNVTVAAEACSARLCSRNGRCARRDPENLNAFLHLHPQSFHIAPADGGQGDPVAVGELNGGRTLKHSEVQSRGSSYPICYKKIMKSCEHELQGYFIINECSGGCT